MYKYIILLKIKSEMNSLLSPIGKIPPAALEVEEAVLGAILLESASLNLVEDILCADDFYNPIHVIIFKAILRLRQQKQAIDMLTVTQELNKSGELKNVGGAYTISMLTSKVVSSAHIEYHVRILKDKSIARKLIDIIQHVLVKAYDESKDIKDVLEELEIQYTSLITNKTDSSSISMSEALSIVLKEYARIQDLHNKGICVNITTGIGLLDQAIGGGWKPQTLNVLGARPSMGKTQHALFYSKAAALAGKKVLFASLEMSTIQLVTRLILENEQINSYHVQTGQMSAEEWNIVERIVAELWNMNLYIAADSNIRYLNAIKSEARRLKRLKGLDMLVIDYLGLIRTQQTFSTRYLQIGYITSELKNLAKELNIAVLLLSQLNRPIKGIVKEPQLDDLRESGDIEQDADIVLFIHKPDYYDPLAIDSEGKAWQGRGKIIVGKYREGIRNNSIIFYHDKRYKKISDTPFSSDIPF